MKEDLIVLKEHKGRQTFLVRSIIFAPSTVQAEPIFLRQRLENVVPSMTVSAALHEHILQALKGFFVRCKHPTALCLGSSDVITLIIHAQMSADPNVQLSKKCCR